MMLSKQEQVKAALADEEITFAAVSLDGELRTSTLHGIAPMMQMLQEDPEFLEGAFVADKMIGKAAAFLLIKGKVAYLYTDMISSYGAEVLEENKIDFEYKEMVEYILNRTGDGMCLMESVVLEAPSAEDAYLKLQNKLAEIRANQ